MKSNRKALLALVGAIIAAIAVAYGAGVFDRASDDGVQSAALTGGGTQGDDQADAGEGGADGAGIAGQPDDSAAPSGDAADDATDAPAASEQAEPVAVPGFDLLRVEPSGDMVIAGSAAPGSIIEIVSGADVLSTVEAGPTGDFAAVLDERLKPGDYQIVLRATSPEGSVATSTGTAIVSVPETLDGEVLALVDEPGKASRLISGTGGTAAEQVTAQASAPADSQTGTDGGTQSQAEAAASSEETVAEEAETPAEAATNGEAATAEAPTDDAQPAGDEQTQMAAVAPEAETEAGTASADTASEADAATAPDETDAQAGETEAAETPEPATAPTQNDIQVAIEAVEIEGPFVFVAGAAPPGQVVRVYANDILLGDARTSPQGRFLIEARRDLPQGDYVIRADVLAPNRSDVLARAAVPFRREPGENIAAVAAPSGTDDTQAADETAQASVEDSSADDARGSDVAAAEQPSADGNTPTDTGSGAAQEAAEVAAEAPASGGSSDTETVAAADTGSQPATDQGDGSTNGASATAATETAAPSQEAQPELPQLQTALAQTPPVITAAPLQPVDRSVIIRRGDTLWHISRRVYGRGIRYTTIYKANTDQIRDPDLIFPGQVFGVPEQSDEGEAADMSQLRSEEE